MNGACEFCGGSCDQLHHPTGRDHEGRYLDPMLVLRSDHSCHVFVHDDWRHEEIDELKQPRSIVEYIEIRLRRLAMNLGRIDQRSGGGTFWGRLAEAFMTWAEELRDHVRLLDRHYPGWRGKGGFMH
jgi:hypothetical protein